MDPLDARLSAAGRYVRDDADLVSALEALAEARAEGARRRRRRRFAAPVLTLGAVLALTGAGGVAATQWGSWSIADPDIVITRQWTDVAGTYLGTCESRIRASDLPEEKRARVREYFTTVDLDAFQPDPEFVALHLKIAGRLEDLGRLVPGADPDDFRTDELERSENQTSDARVMQDALAQTIAHELFLHVGRIELWSTFETQCSEDPAEGRS